MPTHHQTLARLDLLVAEARDLCSRAQDVRPGVPDAAIPLAFRTVLGRQVRDWMLRAERMVRTVKPDGDTLCGQRASEVRRLVDAANVAMMKRSDSGESWNAFQRSAREIKPAVPPAEH
jgi:hypothetical protein